MSPTPSKSPGRNHLGTFEGERNERSRGYREDQSLSKLMASGLCTLAFLTALAFVCGSF